MLKQLPRRMLGAFGPLAAQLDGHVLHRLIKRCVGISFGQQVDQVFAQGRIIGHKSWLRCSRGFERPATLRLQPHTRPPVVILWLRERMRESLRFVRTPHGSRNTLASAGRARPRLSRSNVLINKWRVSTTSVSSSFALSRVISVFARPPNSCT